MNGMHPQISNPEDDIQKLAETVLKLNIGFFMY